ncbi:MAG: hypothetical protein WDM77_21745 [Steroidobacteraceae bacterium]
MTTVFTTKVSTTLLLAGAAVMSAVAAHAGPQVTFYVTVPLDGPSNGHVLGLRLDHAQSVPDVRNFNPSSPLNRRPWLDLQFGKDSALRLELDRRLTWDITQQSWHETSRPATVTLRVPTHHSSTESASSLGASAAYAASLANPFKDQGWKPLVKPLAIEP